MKSRILYMGTPFFSAQLLDYLLNNDFNIVGVVSQPDKLKGRNRVLTPTDTKIVANKYNIPIYQPELIKDNYEFIKELDVDIILTCAYGQFLPKGLLAIPKKGCLNVHASLLPKYRGGAPIQRAIINGEKETGVCLMEMISKMDAGRVYACNKIDIDINDTYDKVVLKLIEASKRLVKDNLEKYLDDKLEGLEQDESNVSFAYNIEREEEKIDFNKSVVEIHNLIRGLSLLPGAYCLLDDIPLKILESRIYSEKKTYESGFVSIIDKKLIVDCGDGQLEIICLQLSGKNRMDAKSFINGFRNKIEGKILK